MASLTVLLFASYAEAFAAQALSVEVPSGATVGDLINVLKKKPGGETLPAVPLVAVNQEYASADRVLHPGDEIAIIPATAGG